MNQQGITLDRVVPLSLERAEEVAGVKEEVDMDLFPFFEEEAQAELAAIESILHTWDQEPVSVPIKDLRRQFHTLQGAANSIGHIRIGALAGGMKDVLDELPETQAIARRAPIIKTCIFFISTVRSLLRETRSPQYNPAGKEQIVAAIRSIGRLRETGAGMKGAA